jgi:hypothetical protein
VSQSCREDDPHLPSENEILEEVAPIFWKLFVHGLKVNYVQSLNEAMLQLMEQNHAQVYTCHPVHPIGTLFFKFTLKPKCT